MALLAVLALAWLVLMWFFNLYDEFWWNVLSVVAVTVLMLWASARSRSAENTRDTEDGED